MKRVRRRELSYFLSLSTREAEDDFGEPAEASVCSSNNKTGGLHIVKFYAGLRFVAQ